MPAAATANASDGATSGALRNSESADSSRCARFAGGEGRREVSHSLAFTRLEHFPQGDPAVRGRGGPIHCTSLDRFDPLSDAFLGACMYNQNSRYYPFLVDAEGDYSSVSFVSRLPKSFLRSRKFDGADIRRVQFTVEDGPGGDKQLVLRQNVLLLEPDKDEVENPLVVARDVKLFVVEFIDPKTHDWTSEWPYTNQIPSEIRIQLALGSQDKHSEKPVDTLVGVVAPLTQAVRPEWQMPIGQTLPPQSTNGLNPNGQNPGGFPGLQPGGKGNGAGGITIPMPR